MAQEINPEIIPSGSDIIKPMNQEGINVLKDVINRDAAYKKESSDYPQILYNLTDREKDELKQFWHNEDSKLPPNPSLNKEEGKEETCPLCDGAGKVPKIDIEMPSEKWFEKQKEEIWDRILKSKPETPQPPLPEQAQKQSDIDTWVQQAAEEYVTESGWGPDFCAEGHDMIKCYKEGFKQNTLKSQPSFTREDMFQAASEFCSAELDTKEGHINFDQWLDNYLKQRGR